MMRGRIRVGSSAAGAVRAMLFAGLAGCASLTPAPVAVPEGGDAHVGAHITILCHFRCGPAGERALQAAERAWDGAALLLGTDVTRRPSRPIHLYRTEHEYEEVEAELTGGRFRQNRAMTYRGTEAHISVHPFLTETALREFGLTSNTLRVVAHEAAHIAIRTLEPRARDLPDWLDEGLSSSLELDVLLELGLADSREEEPVSSTRLYLLRERVRREAMPPLARLLDGDETGLTLAERYAFYQHFMDFLRTGEYRTRLLATLRSLRTIDASPRRLRDLLIVSVIGSEPESIGRADAAFRAWLLRMDPVWVQARRALSTDGSKWIQIGFENGAEAWRAAPPAVPPYVLHGGVRILEGSGTATVLVALAGNARLAIVFATGELRLERMRYAGDTSPELLVRQARPIGAGKVPFRILVDEDGVTAEVGGAAPLRAELATGPGWGLAAGPRANIVWSDIAVAEAAR